jgi:hypothetical protein
MRGPVSIALHLLLGTVGLGCSAEEAALLVRARNLIVPPATGPVTHVVVRNRLATPYAGALRVEWPEGWQASPAEHAANLAPGETQAFAFTIQRATNLASNAYPLRVRVNGAAGTLDATQTVVCAGAPYGQPEIDGELGDWEGAIPLALTVGGKRAVVRTLWNRRQFCLAVEVQEASLFGLAETSAETGPDAVQFALSKPPAQVGGPNDDRYEFLVASAGAGQPDGKCFVLRPPGRDPQPAAQSRPLAGLELAEAQVAVKRAEDVTRYEVAVPFAAMPDLRPTTGRELCFSLLVHDPDGTGLRDLGEVMNQWEESRREGAWCSWEGARWGGQLPFGSAIEFGLCSSVE